MGAGTTAGNVGQLVGISGTINGATESAIFTYDLVGRLTTSNQTTGGFSAQRRFQYDRWGNRTQAWDAVTGGTQLQGISLEKSAGVPTNHIQAINSPANNVASATNGATASAGLDYALYLITLYNRSIKIILAQET